ncbi:hypothetical protein GCM10007979_07740 [Nocardioides albus]|nr:hypothetical protein GCM10007979_07740 [Nocardioides albus]
MLIAEEVILLSLDDAGNMPPRARTGSTRTHCNGRSWATVAVRTALRPVGSGAGDPPRGESPTQGFNGEGNAGW